MNCEEMCVCNRH